MDVGLLAGLSAAGGGTLVKVVDYILHRGHTRFDEEMSIRKELRTEAERLGKELSALRTENNLMRRNYWDLVSSNSKLGLRLKTIEIENDKLSKELAHCIAELNLRDRD